MPVDLPDLVGHREELEFDAAMFSSVCGDQPADRLVVAVGDRQIDARAAVGRRAEDEPLLAEADAPRVVVGVAEELELRAVGLEPVEAPG